MLVPQVRLEQPDHAVRGQPALLDQLEVEVVRLVTPVRLDRQALLALLVQQVHRVLHSLPVQQASLDRQDRQEQRVIPGQLGLLGPPALQAPQDQLEILGPPDLLDPPVLQVLPGQLEILAQQDLLVTPVPQGRRVQLARPDLLEILVLLAPQVRLGLLAPLVRPVRPVLRDLQDPLVRQEILERQVQLERPDRPDQQE